MGFLKGARTVVRRTSGLLAGLWWVYSRLEPALAGFADLVRGSIVLTSPFQFPVFPAFSTSETFIKISKGKK
jgi:hypothetical protein